MKPGAAAILQSQILIVDDHEVDLNLLGSILRNAGYVSVTSTVNPLEVCELHARNHYDLILLDLNMPGMDGYAVMDGLREIDTGNYLPVLVITAQQDHKIRALKAGAKDFIDKPFEIAEVLARVQNFLEVRLLHRQLNHNNHVLEQGVQDRVADLHNNYLETVLTMTRATAFKDEDTGNHVRRISYYCRDLARLLGQDETFVDEIFFAGPMHDIGKIGIPDRILLKPGGFEAGEWEIMKTHTTIGAKILGNSRSPYLKMGAEIALNHHECWNGGGYPSGKHGESIPLAARIMNICDVYDALRSVRTYKPALDHQPAVDIILCGDGRTEPAHFDPVILSAFRQNTELFRDIFDTYAE
jgi:putative two-component system response regulator